MWRFMKLYTPQGQVWGASALKRDVYSAKPGALILVHRRDGSESEEIIDAIHKYDPLLWIVRLRVQLDPPPIDWDWDRDADDRDAEREIQRLKAQLARMESENKHLTRELLEARRAKPASGSNLDVQEAKILAVALSELRVGNPEAALNALGILARKGKVNA